MPPLAAILPAWMAGTAAAGTAATGTAAAAGGAAAAGTAAAAGGITAGQVAAATALAGLGLGVHGALTRSTTKVQMPSRPQAPTEGFMSARSRRGLLATMLAAPAPAAPGSGLKSLMGG
ncbi:MAG: hypothetical protein ABFD96_23750 [Armatimonadia bacterium]